MIKIKNIIFKIDINYKNIKNIYLRIKDNTIVVSAPYLTSLNTINNFIKSKETWIYNHYQKNINRAANVDLDKGTIRLLNKEYDLYIATKNKTGWTFINNKLYIFTRSMKEEQINIIIKQALKGILKEIIKPLIAKWNMVFNRDPKIEIKYLKSKWGICYVNNNKIVLSSMLVHYDMRCIDAVILHEYVHFLVGNHSANFYNIIYKYMPDYDTYKKLLE